jgi:WD40-like Beta Propeller Repeat
MSTGLERRLERAFRRLPQPSRHVSRGARAAALSTLPERRPRRGLGVIFAAVTVVVVLGVVAASLAATGNLHVRLGRGQPRPAPAPSHLQVPSGSNGIAVVAGGKLWLATRRGLRIEGMTVSAAELSPRALYAAAGVGSALVALAPGRRAWTHETGGRVAAIAWSPDGLKIAYVVRRRGGAQLRLIEGDGDHDRLLDRGVAGVKPSWRSDSLAVAYVGAGGRARVYDLGAETSRTFATRSCGGPARALAYAPGAARLAIAGVSGVAVVERWNRRPACVAFERVLAMNSLSWLSGQRLVTSDNPLAGIRARAALRRYGWTGTGLTGAGTAFSRLRLLAAAGARDRLALAVGRRRGIVEVFLVSPPPATATVSLRLGRPLLRIHAAAPVSISWR